MKKLLSLTIIILIIYLLYNQNQKIKHLSGLIQSEQQFYKQNINKLNDLETKFNKLLEDKLKETPIKLDHLSTKNDLDLKLNEINLKFDEIQKEIGKKHNTENCPCNNPIKKQSNTQKISKKPIKKDLVQKFFCPTEQINTCFHKQLLTQKTLCESKKIPEKTDIKFISSNKQISKNISIEEDTVILEHDSEKSLPNNSKECLKSVNDYINQCKNELCYYK